MPLNIIIKNGGHKPSNEQVAEHLARKTDEAVASEKHEYKEKSRQLSKAAESLPKEVGGMRLESVMDARTYFRHVQDPSRQGAMNDDTYRKELLRDNPEIDCR